MKRQCMSCSKISHSPYKDLCKSCYQNGWIKNLKTKTCAKCSSAFRSSGKTCHTCKCNINNEKSRSLTCSNCNRSGLIIDNKTECLCIKCNRIKLEEKDPLRKARRQEYLRNYSRKKRGTDINAPIRKPTGRWKNAQGYIMVFGKKHPNSYSNGCIPEHILIMSSHLGRPLRDKENVHHINGIRDDNRIENLELWHRGQCPGQRVEDKIEWCKNFLEIYGYKVLYVK